ncbi:MAG: hypothetical protein U0796_02735 [Gemmatales bacterium]
MAKQAKSHSERLERLIRIVDKEKEAGRLTEHQVKTIADHSLKPIRESKNALHFFLLGGGISEELAESCADLLVSELKKHLPAQSHVLKEVESLKPPAKSQDR